MNTKEIKKLDQLFAFTIGLLVGFTLASITIYTILLT